MWGGFNGPQNRSAVRPNRRRRLAEFTDALSQTLFGADVKAYQTSSNCRFITLPSVNEPNNIPSPYADSSADRLFETATPHLFSSATSPMVVSTHSCASVSRASFAAISR